jgi:hypothetical protein
MLKWFTLSWYKYLFHKEGWYSKKSPNLKTVICRMRGHPDGVWWYNPTGLKPDMTCKNCGDNLG